MTGMGCRGLDKRMLWRRRMILGESRQTYWLEIIEKELEKLESGDMRALLTVYCAFAVGDKKMMRQAGHVIQNSWKALL